jgi:hypothetical protein
MVTVFSQAGLQECVGGLPMKWRGHPSQGGHVPLSRWAGQYSPAQHSPSQYSPAQYSPAHPSTAQLSTAQPIPIQPSSAQPIPVQPIPAQPIPAQPIPAQPIPAHHSPSQLSTAHPSNHKHAHFLCQSCYSIHYKTSLSAIYYILRERHRLGTSLTRNVLWHERGRVPQKERKIHCVALTPQLSPSHSLSTHPHHCT